MSRNPYTVLCCWPGCESQARPNPADMENGPHPSDLDPVYCPYHEEEGLLISYIEEDVVRALFPHTWQEVLYP